MHSELETDGRNIEESGYYDLVAMQLAHGRSISLIEGGDIKYIAEVMDYYVDHGDLLVNSVRWNIPLLNETLQYMVHLAEWNNDLDQDITKSNIENIIPDASFYDVTTLISNALTEHINKTAIEALSEI